MAKKKPSWEELKTEYVTTGTSYRKLADKYKMSYMLIAKRGAKEDWKGKRKEYAEKVVTKTVDKIANNRADKLATIAESADKMANTIHRVMEDTDQFFRRINLAGDEVVSKKADTKSMKELASAMKDLTAVLRNVYNIPTEAESVSLQLARERLEIEKRNAERDEEVGISTGIVLIPKVLDDEEDD